MGIKEQLEFVNQTTNTPVGTLSEGQTEFLKSIESSTSSSISKEMANPNSEKARTFLQGLTFRFWDEIEGMVVSMLNSDKSYEEARDEVRKKIADYQNNPETSGEALGFEVAGAVAPTIVSLFGGPVGWANATRTLATLGTKLSGRPTLGQIANIGGKGGALYAVGGGEDGLIDDLANAPMGYATGATLAAGMTKGFNWTGIGVNRLIEKAKGMKGKEFSESVRREITRLADGTGYTPNEIIAKVGNGEILAENESLKAVMRALQSDLTDESSKITKATKTRPLQTKTKALDKMQESIGLGSSNKNTVKLWNATDENFKKLENKAYKELFKETNPELPKELETAISEQMQRWDGSAEAIKKLYKARGNIVPFYTVGDDGAISLIRKPRLEDAEIVYRAIRDEASRMFKSGEAGDLASSFKSNSNDLKDLIDNFSPKLAETRATASATRTTRDAYKLGKSALGQNPEELIIKIEKYMETPGAIDALRSGVMTAIKNKSSSQTTIMKNIAEEGHKYNQIVRMIFPEQKVDDILASARVAGQSQSTLSQIRFGSITAQQQSAESTLGQASLVYRATTGDPLAAAQLLQQRLASSRPSLKPEDRSKLIKVLLSEDADLVKKALVDENSMNMLQKSIDSMLYGSGRVVTSGASKLVGAEVGDVDTGLFQAVKSFKPSSLIGSN